MEFFKEAYNFFSMKIFIVLINSVLILGNEYMSYVHCYIFNGKIYFKFNVKNKIRTLLCFSYTVIFSKAAYLKMYLEVSEPK